MWNETRSGFSILANWRSNADVTVNNWRLSDPANLTRSANVTEKKAAAALKVASLKSAALKVASMNDVAALKVASLKSAAALKVAELKDVSELKAA